MDKKIIIGKQIFEHLKTREYAPVSIYKGLNEFLRIGPKEILVPELNLHKKLLNFGFPVPKILSEGEQDGEFFYIEESMGETLLGDELWQNYKITGKVSNEHFNILLNIANKFSQAQLKTATNSRDEESFFLGIHTNYLAEELPEIKTELFAGFKTLINRTAKLPYVLTHGDFNVYNLFEKGVIDFGSNFNAPAGYDIVSPLFHTYNFPNSNEYEMSRRYEFNESQKNSYLVFMDNIFSQAKLPPISEYLEDFIFAKTIWSTARMQQYPKLQKWRYIQFKNLLLKYINGESLMQVLMEN